MKFRDRISLSYAEKQELNPLQRSVVEDRGGSFRSRPGAPHAANDTMEGLTLDRGNMMGKTPDDAWNRIFKRSASPTSSRSPASPFMSDPMEPPDPLLTPAPLLDPVTPPDAFGMAKLFEPAKTTFAADNFHSAAVSGADSYLNRSGVAPVMNESSIENGDIHRWISGGARGGSPYGTARARIPNLSARWKRLGGGAMF